MEDFSECVFHYEEEKEQWLRHVRGLSFDVIVEVMRSGKVVDLLDNPSADYPHKKIALLEIDEYIVAVPYVREGDDVFLKTAFKNRKQNKKFRGKQSYGQQEKNTKLH